MTVQPLVFFNQIAIDANTQKIEIIEESFRKLFAVLMSKKQLTNLTEKFENHRIDYTSNTNETILSINWFQIKQ